MIEPKRRVVERRWPETQDLVAWTLFTHFDEEPINNPMDLRILLDGIQQECSEHPVQVHSKLVDEYIEFKDFFLDTQGK